MRDRCDPSRLTLNLHHNPITIVGGPDFPAKPVPETHVFKSHCEGRPDAHQEWTGDTDDRVNSPTAPDVVKLLGN